jgi:hypothetical protein
MGKRHVLFDACLDRGPLHTGHQRYLLRVARTALPADSRRYRNKSRISGRGAFNRVYGVDAIAKVKASSDAQLKTGIVETIQHFKYVFRVSLPVDPRLKSSSEVATIQYLNECTTVPVTTVLHSSQSAKNALGLNGCFRPTFQGTSSLPSGTSLEMLAASG